MIEKKLKVIFMLILKINKLNFKPKSNLLNNLKYLARIK